MFLHYYEKLIHIVFYMYFGHGKNPQIFIIISFVHAKGSLRIFVQ